jgi:hypothetical protein
MLRSRRVTLSPTTTLGPASNTASKLIGYGRPGCIRAVSIEYGDAGNAERDLIIKADSATGTTLLSLPNTETDVPPSATVKAGIDEAGDPGEQVQGWYFTSGVYIECANMDDDAEVILDLWMEL